MAPLIDLYPWGRFYHRLGTNVLALAPHTKKPIDPWKGWQDRRQTPADLAAQPWRQAGGVGLLSGVGDWRVFDFDHCPTFNAVAALLAALGLPIDYRLGGTERQPTGLARLGSLPRAPARRGPAGQEADHGGLRRARPGLRPSGAALGALLHRGAAVAAPLGPSLPVRPRSPDHGPDGGVP